MSDTGKCGTRAGYWRHRRRKEQACEPCRGANTAYHHANKHRWNLKHYVPNGRPGGRAPIIHLDELEFLYSCGETRESIAQRLGVKASSIYRAELRARKREAAA